MKLTLNRLTYLLYLMQADKEKCTVTFMAKLFRVSKSTVSRNMEYFVSEGIVYKDTMCLTEYGKKLARKYAEEVKFFKGFIEETACCDDDENRDNAMKMVVTLSDNMKQKMFEKYRLKKMFKSIDYRGHLEFSEFVKDLEDGIYPVAFAIYREEIKENKWISMADQGFNHPATIRISGETGIVRLEAVTMERRNVLDRLLMSGKVLGLEYCRKGAFESAVLDGDIYQIPADVFDYHFHKEEGLLMGSLLIRLYAPLGKKKMHKRKAILSLIIRTI